MEELKKGEVYNGGYKIQIGNFTLRNIGGYEPSWETVYDPDGSFTDWKGNTQKFPLGKQFSLKISTGRLIPEDFNALVAELRKSSFMVKCPDFEGQCYCENVPASLSQANTLGVRYKINFTAIAKDILPQGDGL